MLNRSSLLRMFCSKGNNEASRSSSALRRSRWRFDGLLFVTPSLGGGFRLHGCERNRKTQKQCTQQLAKQFTLVTCLVRPLKREWGGREVGRRGWSSDMQQYLPATSSSSSSTCTSMGERHAIWLRQDKRVACHSRDDGVEISVVAIHTHMLLCLAVCVGVSSHVPWKSVNSPTLQKPSSSPRSYGLHIIYTI